MMKKSQHLHQRRRGREELFEGNGNWKHDKRVRVWLFIKEHGLDEETRTRSDERKAQDA